MNHNQLKIVIPPVCGAFEEKVADIFREEVKLRSGIDLERAVEPGGDSYILIRRLDALRVEYPELYARIAGLNPPGPEGFCISVKGAGATCGAGGSGSMGAKDGAGVTYGAGGESGSGALQIVVAGADDRGCLYGMARVLRKLRLKDGAIEVTDELRDMSLTPKYPLRGHQLAYRDKQNTCPTWDLDTFDRYIRDLALFGSNAIEILPPRTDDALFSAHFQRDPFEMMLKLSRVIHSYGMDVWLWYPNMGNNYDDPASFQDELQEREKVFSGIPYLDAVLFPAGDPGDLEPQEFFRVSEANAAILHKYHPHARIWIAPQVFRPRAGWNDEFYNEVDKQPDWLYGLCFAPWERDTIRELRNRIPEKYKNRIRHYPDITHSSDSQFEMPDWDIAFALTSGREGINPRPAAMKHIHNLHAPYTLGSITYCEGIHDDVNKMVWGDQDFDPETSIYETLRDYVRLFVDPDIATELSNLIIDTEANWSGYAAKNHNIDRVYEGFLALEAKVSENVKENYRFQLAMIRALSDYLAKMRRIYDGELEARMLETLAKASETGSKAAIAEARAILRLTFDEPVAVGARARIQQLADSLREKCGIRLTTWRHGAQSWIRGASLDSLDTPLNDYSWYMLHFARIAALPEETGRLQAIYALISRADPGPGGFYDWLGDPDAFTRRVIRDNKWEEDPGYLRTPVICHEPYSVQMRMHRMKNWYDEFPITLRWVGCARVLYGTPLKVKYDSLDPSARYKLRVAYPGLLAGMELTNYELRVTAGNELIWSAPIADVDPKCPIAEYELPPGSYADGALSLAWQMTGTLYPVHVSEIWIIKQ